MTVTKYDTTTKVVMLVTLEAAPRVGRPEGTTSSQVSFLHPLPRTPTERTLRLGQASRFFTKSRQLEPLQRLHHADENSAFLRLG
jgi:hypothetical protein